ncbi:MAG: hypothetical protein Rhims3KO_02540 [Hyphomicrobiales bacterium]
MDLIVDQVESESQVVELLDCKLKYGQGNLFARPRIVDIAPRESAAETPPDIVTQPTHERESKAAVDDGIRRKAPDRRAVRGLSRSA